MLFNDDNFLDIFINGKSISDDTLIYDYQSSNRFYSPKEGLLRGNLFKDSFDPYKDYIIRNIEPTTEKEAILLKIYEYDFAVNELNLYLDLNKDDKEAFTLFKKYVSEYKKYVNMWESKYGPLSLMGNMNSYDWVKGPWPWEGSANNV